MLCLLVAAHLAVTPVPTPPARPARYASAALRVLVARAAAANRSPPPSLDGYRARVESEFAFVLHDTLGQEHATQVEQLEAQASWQRSGSYDLHVIGYRLQSSGAPFSTLSIVRGWTVPVLYGERLSLGARSPQTHSAEDTLPAVHPLAPDRNRFYRFSGGDTIAVLHAAGRSIPVVRIAVTPDPADSTPPFVGFDGDLYVDATRGAIVRMRGRILVVGEPHGGRPLWARLSGTVGAAFIDFQNAEVDGRYWLPAYQRTEFQATVPLVSPGRGVLRIVSRFRRYAIQAAVEGHGAPPPPPAPLAPPAAGDPSVDSTHAVVTWAPHDSLDHFDGWASELGIATMQVNASDFNALAPDAWRHTGGPRLQLVPNHPEKILRFNRVEGAFTGWGGTLRMRNAAPGLTAAAFGGWAWAERTARGGGTLSLNRPPWILGLRAERSLASTNDFTSGLSTGSGDLTALLESIDNYDYVDRWRATTSATRVFGSINRALATVQLGVGEDRPEIARLTRGPFGGPAFLPNRGVLPGRYAFASLDADLHPDVSGAFVSPGIGAHLHYEVAAGQLAWQRAELSLSTRQYWGPVTLAADADGGIVAGATIPPQQLFELGGAQSLAGYSYKEFAGDRAALFGTVLSYQFPLWTTPHRVWHGYFVPGLAPGIAAGVEGGWSELSTAASRAAVNALGAGWSTVPVSRATDGVRASVALGLTFFSGTFHVGVARPVDHPGPWRVVAGFGRAF